MDPETPPILEKMLMAGARPGWKGIFTGFHNSRCDLNQTNMSFC